MSQAPIIAAADAIKNTAARTQAWQMAMGASASGAP
jgi:hypothetical protein